MTLLGMCATVPAYITVVRLLVLVRREVPEQEEPSRVPVLVLSLGAASVATLSQGYRNAASLVVIRDMYEPLHGSSRSMRI